ncbi:MAG: restriction endonuclease subunit S [Acidimicrobiales bacterium]
MSRLRVHAARAPIRTFSLHEVRARGAISGDLIIEKSGGSADQAVGRAVIWDGNGVVMPTNFAARLRTRPTNDVRFVAYLLASLWLRGRTRTATNQTTGIQNLDLGTFLNERVTCPDRPTQRTIADYLDRETARIDALIAEKRHMVELVEERWHRLLNDTIWGQRGESVPLRRVARFVDYRGATPAKQDEGIPLITAGHVGDGVVNHSVDPQFISESVYAEWMHRGMPSIGDVIITTEAPLGEVAQIQDAGIALAQRVILLKSDLAQLASDYLALTLRSPRFQAMLEENATGSTALGIKADRLKSLSIPLPNPHLQSSIVAALRMMDDERRQLVRFLSRQTELLCERRQALITAAVTGRLDISKSAPAVAA